MSLLNITNSTNHHPENKTTKILCRDVFKCKKSISLNKIKGQ